MQKQEELKKIEEELKKPLYIPFYSLNDQTATIYPLLWSKITLQKRQIIDQVLLFFNLEFI